MKYKLTYLFLLLAGTLFACRNASEPPSQDIPFTADQQIEIFSDSSFIFTYPLSPLAIAINPASHLYVSSDNGYIYRIDPEHQTILDSIGGIGQGPGEFYKAPVILDVYRDSLLMAIEPPPTSAIHLFACYDSLRFIKKINVLNAILDGVWWDASHVLISAIPFPGETGIQKMDIHTEKVEKIPHPPVSNPFEGLYFLSTRKPRESLLVAYVQNRVLLLRNDRLYRYRLPEVPERAPMRNETILFPGYGEVNLPEHGLFRGVASNLTAYFLLTARQEQPVQRLLLLDSTMTLRSIQPLEEKWHSLGVQDSYIYALTIADSLGNRYIKRYTYHLTAK